MMRLFCFVYFHTIYVYQLNFRLLSTYFLDFLSNQMKYFHYKIRLHINDRKIVGIRFFWTYACAMINYVIWSSLHQGICECRLWIPYSSNPRGSTRPRVSRRKNPYLSMNSGLKTRHYVILHVFLRHTFLLAVELGTRASLRHVVRHRL